jgi:hypothetical protein
MIKFNTKSLKFYKGINILIVQFRFSEIDLDAI